MATLKLARQLVAATGGQAEITLVDGPLVSALAEACERHPMLADVLFAEDGRLSGAFALAIGGELLPRGSFESVCLTGVDRVELIRPIAGG